MAYICIYITNLESIISKYISKAMRKSALFNLIIAAALGTASAWAQYAPAGNKIMTQWGENINPQSVWNEYPRPIMKRDAWANLNGLWHYAVTPMGSAAPQAPQGSILVPFCIESALSGVGKTLSADKELWYTRSFSVPSAWRGKNVLLHFGAVDWKADVWVNGIKVGSHTGGYTAFSFDITAALNAKGENTLQVRVVDGTDTGYQPRGKQVSDPKGIWYTSVSGIWQTVWLEPVPENHITRVLSTPDIDHHTLTVDVATSLPSTRAIAEVIVKDGSQIVARGRSINSQPVVLHMPADAKLWSPDSPFLYDVEATISIDGRTIDRVASYAAMRKVATQRDSHGIVRLTLNNQPIFHFGPLDQGWWPDGLYTAPSYEAMIYDLDKTKQWGFNMIRKHVKVEPELWYAYCDRIGIIVWQDMPSGDRGPEWQNKQYFNGVERLRSPESEANFRKEWTEIITQLSTHPCINVWVPFNESWGQFKTQEIVDMTRLLDPTRLINPASGGNFYALGDILDLHNYPGPDMYLFDATRANVLGEYGGIGYAVKGHLWFDDRNWGYVQFNSVDEVTDQYEKYADQLLQYVQRGFTAAVYTQTTDVEGEVNGFMTYDRRVVKMHEQRLRTANLKLIHSLTR